VNTFVTDLFDQDLLEQHVRERNIRRQRHPDLPLTIYNYTERCVYERAWDEVTLACRGLIIDDEGIVRARPFPKFFNYGQPDAPNLNLRARAQTTDKIDGSLGILYPDGSGHSIATRGSFTSEQALHATTQWKARYEGSVDVGEDLTWLFEVVYPANRIVVDYGEMDDLVLLGGISIPSGNTAPREVLQERWPGPAATTFGYDTLADALEAAPRDNAEGLVVHLPETEERIKLKQEDYIALHRIVTGLSGRTVWQHLLAGLPLEELIAPLPDEFHNWVRSVADTLHSQVADRKAAIESAYEKLLAELPEGWTRKDFAAAAVPHPERAALFALHDGKDITPTLWRDAKPEPFWTPAGRTYTEETA